MRRVQFLLEPVTPIAMGGATPDARAEVRSASLKGLLRWWYRAIDPGSAPDREARLFGHVRDGGARGLVQVRVAQRFSTENWSRARYEAPPFQQAASNGFRYLAFPWFMDGGLQRRWIAPAPAAHFKVELAFAPQLANDECLRVLAAFWALLNLGGVGGRSRRGFGSLHCKETTVLAGALDVPVEHFSPQPLETTAHLKEVLRRGLEWIRNVTADEVPGVWGTHVPSIGAASRVLVRQRAFKDDQAIAGWEFALDDVGLFLQSFRSGMPPDYRLVKDALLALATRPAVMALPNAPARAAFGMPLTFQYRSIPATQTRKAEFTPQGTSDRWGSPLLVRVARVGNAVCPVVVRLDAPVPGAATRVQAKAANGAQSTVDGPTGTILDDFCDYCVANGFAQVGHV